MKISSVMIQVMPSVHDIKTRDLALVCSIVSDVLMINLPRFKISGVSKIVIELVVSSQETTNISIVPANISSNIYTAVCQINSSLIDAKGEALRANIFFAACDSLLVFLKKFALNTSEIDDIRKAYETNELISSLVIVPNKFNGNRTSIASLKMEFMTSDVRLFVEFFDKAGTSLKQVDLLRMMPQLALYYNVFREAKWASSHCYCVRTKGDILSLLVGIDGGVQPFFSGSYLANGRVLSVIKSLASESLTNVSLLQKLDAQLDA